MVSFKRSAIGPAMLSLSSINIRGCTASGPHDVLTFKLVINVHCILTWLLLSNNRYLNSNDNQYEIVNKVPLRGKPGKY